MLRKALVLALVSATACGPATTYFGHQPGEPWGVAIIDSEPPFFPQWLDLPAGSTVSWWNQTSSPAVVHSGTPKQPTTAFVFWIAPESRASYTFTRSGTFEFFLTGRPNQTGRAIIR